MYSQLYSQFNPYNVVTALQKEQCTRSRLYLTWILSATDLAVSILWLSSPGTANTASIIPPKIEEQPFWRKVTSWRYKCIRPEGSHSFQLFPWKRDSHTTFITSLLSTKKRSPDPFSPIKRTIQQDLRRKMCLLTDIFIRISLKMFFHPPGSYKYFRKLF